MNLFGTVVHIQVEEKGKTKKCIKCKKIKNYSEFPKANGAQYPRAECKDCNKKLAKQRKRHRQEQGEPDENYRCPICLMSAEEIGNIGGNAGVWCVDHNHKTDIFRGYLCHRCNRGIGCFWDDEERLFRAINYLKGN